MNGLTFQLHDYRLFRAEFQVKGPVSGGEELGYDTNLLRSQQIDKEKVVLTLGIRISGEKMPFVIDIQYQGVFLFNQDLVGVEEKTRDEVIAVDCSGQLFPFIRETIAEMTRKAGLPPLILPALNFAELYENQAKSPGKS
jgi:preprotein translocase subunit SecB